MKSLDTRRAERLARRKAAGHNFNPGEIKSAESDSKGLGDKTVPQLKAYAAEKGYDLGDATKKDDILAAIELALEGQ